MNAIGPGHGRVKIADSTWLADGPELAAGNRVRVVGARGPVLLVVPGGGRAGCAACALGGLALFRLSKYHWT